MSLIPDYIVVASHYPVDPASTPTIRAGQFVKLDSNGYAVLHTGTSARSIGIAGDSTVGTTGTAGNLTKATAYSDVITINSAGQTVKTQNRVSDPSANETAASGRITVYNGGGQFSTDMFETLDGGNPITYTPGAALYISSNGKLTTNSGSVNVVGTVVVAPRAYPSGVPGTQTTDGSTSLGSFITFKLEI